MNHSKGVSFVKTIAIPLMAGVLSALLTRKPMMNFNIINKPVLSPPAFLFPVVWTILYTLMGISFYLILTSESDQKEIGKAAWIYELQLAVNFLWPTFFFNLQWYLFSFIWVLLLWILVLIMIWKFSKVSKVAALLNVPYLIWLTFAAYLNLAIFILNR